MTATRRDVLKTAFVTLAAASSGIRIGRYANADDFDPRGEAVASTERSRLAREAFHFRQSGRADFQIEAREIYARHWGQTVQTVAALRRQYERPVLGRVRVWDAIQKLARCVDRSDTTLFCTSQLVHVEQVLASMEADGVNDNDMILAAATHDLGKILLLEGERPENVLCANRPIGKHPCGVGLDQVVFQWNHDEFVYSRLKDHVPEHVAWLLRYHSIDLRLAAPLMNPRDLLWSERYLLPFRRYDVDSKSAFSMPVVGTLDRYRDVIEEAFPKAIPI